MTAIRDLAEAYWRGEVDLVHDEHPAAPLERCGAEEILPGVLYHKRVAAVVTIDTGDGLVMLDTGGYRDIDTVYEAVRAWRPHTRLAAAVYSHHHVDHVFGTRRFDAEAADQGWRRPVVYAHDNVPDHFRRYQLTHGWNSAINARQFAFPVARFPWPTDFREPDVTFADHLHFRQGRVSFELHHARGESDDAIWVWVPELKLLHPGDLFIYTMPNAGNPQKVQRYLSDWADALRAMARLDAEVMMCGHGLPIFGAERIREALTATADYLDAIEDQVVALMNTGANLDTILQAVTPPADLAERPYLKAVYDHPQFLVRSVWRRYGGWWDGEPDSLLPAPRVQRAREWVDLAGGVDTVVARATALAEQGELPLACHLIEAAAIVAPDSAAAHAARAAIYHARAAEQDSLMARNILAHAARSSEQGRRDVTGNW